LPIIEGTISVLVEVLFMVTLLRTSGVLEVAMFQICNGVWRGEELR
jgi:hypothetical protein